MYVRQYTSSARAREKPCVRCGLSLRKHLDDRYCPDCGLSVWVTLNGNDALDYSNPHWLRRAARGAWMMAGVQLVAYVAYFLMMAAMVSPIVDIVRHPPAQRHDGRVQRSRMQESRLHASQIHESRLGESSSIPATAPAAADESSWEDNDDAFFSPGLAPSLTATLAEIVGGIYFILEGAGLLLLTVHEQRFPDRARSIRIAARVMAGISLVVGGLLLVLAIPSSDTATAAHPFTLWIFGWIVELTFAACAGVSWFWLRPIARRAGKSSLTKLCGYLLFLPVLPFLKAAPFLGLWMFYLVSPLMYFLPIVYIPLSVYLFARCAWLLQSAIPHAEAAWAAETKAVAATV